MENSTHSTQSHKMNGESKCPFSSGILKHAAGGGTTNKDWWPNQLNLKILHQHSNLSNPMDEAFNYVEEFKKLDLKAVKKDLNALMTEIESQLVNFAPVRVISLEDQGSLIDEIRHQQQSGAFDQEHMARWGKQMGVRYIVSGKVFSTDERTESARRVQYYLFIRTVDVETGDILFQNQAPITKSII